MSPYRITEPLPEQKFKWRVVYDNLNIVDKITYHKSKFAAWFNAWSFIISHPYGAAVIQKYIGKNV